MREQLLALLKQYPGSSTNEEIEDYVDKCQDKFWLYIKNKTLLGYAAFYTAGETAVIYDLICIGDLRDMLRYCKKEMKARSLRYLEFKRLKYGDTKHRRYRLRLTNRVEV